MAQRSRSQARILQTARRARSTLSLHQLQLQHAGCYPFLRLDGTKGPWLQDSWEHPTAAYFQEVNNNAHYRRKFDVFFHIVVI
jgi:hypothetical protein